MTYDEVCEAWKTEKASWSQTRKDALNRQPYLLRYVHATFFETRGHSAPNELDQKVT